MELINYLFFKKMKHLQSIFSAEQFRYIFRNLGRKKNQTFFTVICIFISSVIIFFHISLTNGIQESLKTNVNEAISGQLMVYNSDNVNQNILEAQLKDQNKFEWSVSDKDALMRINPNFIINERVRFGSLVSYKDETSYIYFHALEKDHLERLGVLLTLTSGHMPTQPDHIIVSETMLDELHCHPGDTLLLIADNTNDYMSDEIGIISGVFEEKGIALYFGYNGFMPYSQGKEIVQADGDHCLEFIINPAISRQFTQSEIARLELYLKQNYPELKIVSWENTVPLFYKIGKVWKGTGKLNTLTFTIFSLIILITLITLIIHSRRHEFGTLLTFGFSWKKVTLMLSSEYLVLTTGSILLSYLLCILSISLLPPYGFDIASTDLQSALMTDKIKFILYTSDFFFVSLLFILSTVAALWISLRKIKKEKLSTLIKTQ